MQIARLSKSYVINNYIIALNIKHIYPSIKFKSIEEKIKEFQKNFSIFEARKTSFPRMNRRAEGRSERCGCEIKKKEESGKVAVRNSATLCSRGDNVECRARADV